MGKATKYKIRSIDIGWLNDVLDGKIKVQDVQPDERVVTRTQMEKYRVESGKLKGRYRWKKTTTKEVVTEFRNGRDAIAFYLLTGDKDMIKKVLDKLLPNKTDITSGNSEIKGGFIVLPEQDKK